MAMTSSSSSAAPARRSPRWTSLVGAGLRVRVARRVRLLNDLDYWTRGSVHLQRNTLRKLLRTAADTEFGRSHSFTRLAAAPDDDLVRAYRAEVPPADFGAFRPLVARMREHGERDILWPGLVQDFAQTSGTTAGDKFIPVTKEM